MTTRRELLTGAATAAVAFPAGLLVVPVLAAPPENWPLQSFDAADWAKAFNQAVDRLPGIQTKLDEGFLIAWFANALMRGYDEYAQRSQARWDRGEWPYWRDHDRSD